MILVVEANLGKAVTWQAASPRVVVATDPAPALLAALELDLRAAIVNLDLEYADGLGVVRVLRSVVPHLWILALSARADDVVKAVELGASDVRVEGPYAELLATLPPAVPVRLAESG